MASSALPPPDRRSRTIGALLALHAGDSLGATLEFKSHAHIASIYPKGLRKIIGGGPFEWPPGYATDDTDLTRGVLLAYRDQRRSPEAGEDIAVLAGGHFLAWLEGRWPGREKGSYPVDIGGATAAGLRRFSETRDPDRAGAGPGSAGNGSLMRCLPTGLFQADRQELVKESMRISKITHDDVRCTVACAAYNTIVAELIDGTSPDDAVSAGEKVAATLEDGRQDEVHQAILLGRELDVAHMAQRGPPPILKGACSGYVLETLTVAVSALLDKRGLEDVLVDVIRIGRDTDTNGAVAGGLLGARHGMEAIPEQWRQELQFGDEFQELATELMEV